ncbi:MAG TPA: acyltransferase [Opitutaceae bacterium]|nr:acyltransferase [Opitutaceae bacterium]
MSIPLSVERPGGIARLAWVDQLRTLVIVLVVNMHACVTYSHVGSWYVKEPPDPPLRITLAFAFWQGHLQSFFMGILFFVAGYFAHGSLERRGPAGFVRERLVRLGLPTLLYMLAVHPLITLVINPNGDNLGSLAPAYARYLARGRFLAGTGPMWFTAALLIFSAVLAGWRSGRPAPPAAVASSRPIPRPAAICAWALVLAGASFLVRTAQPIGTSVLNMQLAFFPQYILAFSAGVASARGGWFEPLARSALARRAGWLGLILGPVALAAVLAAGGILSGKGLGEFMGGWRFESLGLATWEQLAGVGLGLGALAFCSGELDKPTPLSRWLADRSFAVYLFHPVVLVLFTLALRPVSTDPFLKVSMLTAAGLTGSFIAADIARRIPGLRAIL